MVMRAGGTMRAAAAVTAGVCLCAAAPAPEPASVPLDGGAIFSRVRKAWGEGAYPRWAEYATVVEFHKDGHLVRRTWDTTEDLRHGVVFSRKFSREDMTNPNVPHGINIAIPFLGNLNPAPVPDPIGHVAFAIDQDDGMSPSGRHITLATSDRALDEAGTKLPLIGRTGTIERDYDVKLLETLHDERGTEYHLGLTPLRDPAKHRLRELYVDGASFLPEASVVEGIGSRAPLTKVRWRVEYTQIEGATYIARETALADLDYGSRGMLKWTVISFAELQLGARRPAWSLLGLDDDDPQTEP